MTLPARLEMAKMSKIWAVAKNTIAQAVRMKVVAVVILLLLLLLPLMSRVMVGDNTLHGKLQTFISYGLSLTNLLLCVLTIVISCYTLTSDLKGKEIFLVVTKPVRRFQVICGKLLGVIILDIFLLAVFSGIIYTLTLTIGRVTEADPKEIIQIKREFFTARDGAKDPINENQVNKMVASAYAKLEKNNELPPAMSEGRILAQLRDQALASMQFVGAGETKAWEFNNLKILGSDETIFVRYKYDVTQDTPDLKVRGMWRVGDFRQMRYGPGELQTPVYKIERADAIDIFHEFEVPADAIAKDGFLSLGFYNPRINNASVIPQEIEILYRAGSFGANYFRVTVLILARLVFLAALGISLSTWLSFPVAILICVVIFSVGTVSGFVTESLEVLSESIQMFYNFTIRPILWFFPRFDGDFNPTHFMVEGKLLSISFLVKTIAVLVGIKSLVLTLFGILIFSNREIAKPTA